jgi:deazaflavin-dependent oxidoreductase (nitroreductase family)
VADEIGEQLANWGRVALLETRGRVSGDPVRTAVGFVEEPGGSLLVAAGSETADWALNLLVEPRCTASVGDATADYVAEQIAPAEAAAVISALILKYGTPAERLGRGPAFRLRPQRA